MKAGITACSNGQFAAWKKQNDELIAVLQGFGIESVPGAHIYAKEDEFSGADEERAADLVQFYQDDSIDAIYDISGGDLANGILNYLDFGLIANSGKMLWGYSDLATVMNAIYAITGRPSVLWQVKNLVYSEAKLQRARFREFMESNSKGLFDVQYGFLQGSQMKGTLVGGNIRCLTKLAGTKFWPDMHEKILLLESLGGTQGQIASLFSQLEQIGVFDQVAGILLGTFTNYEKADYKMTVFDLLKMHLNRKLPGAYTREIGNGHDSKAIVIGREIVLEMR